MPHLQKMPFDPLKDITPVARISIHSIVICVSGKSPINSMKDLVEYAKKGNKVTAAVSTAAGSVDLVMRAISKRAEHPDHDRALRRRRRFDHCPGGRPPHDRRRPSLRGDAAHQGRPFQGDRRGSGQARPRPSERPDPEGTGDQRRHLGLGEGCRRPERHAARDRRIPLLDPEEGLRGPGSSKRPWPRSTSRSIT